jgi:hypothetical protein
MPNVKMTEIEAQYQRINIFKGKQHRLIYYRPMLKKMMSSKSRFITIAYL